MCACVKRGNTMRFFLARLVSTVVIFCLCLFASAAYASPVIAAYQEIYRMNFEVAAQDGLPSGWYVTGDGYPVAQVRLNHWVYGRSGQPGMLVPTHVAVGAVVPMHLPQLARAAVFSGSDRIYGTTKFAAIANSRYDNMGVLSDRFVYTPVAWRSNEAGIMIWLGNKWYKITPRSGQSTYRAFMSRHPYMVRTLKENDARWTMYDTEELADLAREWGFVWRGLVNFECLPKYDYGTGPDGSDGIRQTISINAGAETPPVTDTNTGGGQWDVGGDGVNSGVATGGSGGGGWDNGAQ